MTRKLEKLNAQGYIWGKLESTTTRLQLDLETVQESIQSGTLTREPNNQLGTHDLEMLDHPLETWESFNRQDRLSNQQSEVWTDLCATSRNIRRIQEIQNYHNQHQNDRGTHRSSQSSVENIWMSLPHAPIRLIQLSKKSWKCFIYFQSTWHLYKRDSSSSSQLSDLLPVVLWVSCSEIYCYQCLCYPSYDLRLDFEELSWFTYVLTWICLEIDILC